MIRKYLFRSVERDLNGWRHLKDPRKVLAMVLFVAVIIGVNWLAG